MINNKVVLTFALALLLTSAILATLSVGEEEHEIQARTLLDTSLTANDTSIGEAETITVTGAYDPSGGGGRETWTIGLNDTNNNILVDAACGAGEIFAVTGIAFTAGCGGGDTCTNNGDGTASITENGVFTVVWTMTSCSGSSSYSPVNLITYESTANDETLDATTGDITILGDVTPPVPTVDSMGDDTSPPWSTSDTSPEINLTLDENGDCRASDIDETYDNMADNVDCTGDGTTSITCQMGALLEAASDTIYVACQDSFGNKDTVATNEEITLEIDATVPAPSNYNPPSGSTITSTSQTLTFDTDETGDCFASLDGDEAYDDMADDFDCTVGTATSHSCSLTGLSEGSNTIYIACEDDTDAFPNKDTAVSNEFMTLTVDSTPPSPTVDSVGDDTSSPWSTSDTSPEINLTLNENGDCRASDIDETYDNMADNVDCTGDGTTSITCQMGTLVEATADILYVACQDSLGNKDTIATNEELTVEIDATPPAPSNYNPASGSNICSTTQTLTFDTDETGDCFASLDGDEAYDDMADDFDCTVGAATSHSCSLTGLSGGANTIYIACEDDTNASPTKDTIATNEFITINVDSNPPTPTVDSVGDDASSPWSTSDTTPEINLTINKNGDCRASETDETYDNMADNVDCTGDGTTSINCQMGALAEAAADILYVACMDTCNNNDTAGTNEEITVEIDATPPAPSNYNPASGATITSTSQTLTFDTDETGDCFASLDGDEAYDDMADDFDCTVGTATSHSCSLTGLSEGSNTIYIACEDDTDASLNKDTAGTNELITLTVDSTPPTPTVNSVGSDASSPWSTSDTTPEINLTLNENGDCRASEIDETYDNMADNVDCTGDGTTSITCQMGTLVEAAADTLYVACRDSSGNNDTAGTNEEISVEIDATPPAPSNYNPASGATITSTGQTLTFDTDEAGDCFASLDADEAYGDMSDDFDCTVGTATSHSCSLTGLSEGSNTLYIACEDDTDASPNKDTAGTNEFITLTVDTTPPSIVLNSPDDEYNTSSATITFNFTATDNTYSTLNCSLYINGTLNQTNSSVSNGTVATFDVGGLTDNTYNWSINCSDGKGNSNLSGTRTFRVDTVGSLSVSLITPSDPTAAVIGNTFYLAGTASCAGDSSASAESCGMVNATGMFFPAAGGEPNQEINSSSSGMTLSSGNNPTNCGSMTEGDSCSFNITVSVTATGSYEVEIEAGSDKAAVSAAESSQATINVAGAATSISLSAPATDPNIYQLEDFDLTCQASCSGSCTNVIVYPYYCSGAGCTVDSYITTATTDLTANQSSASLGSVSSGSPESYTFLITATDNDSYTVTCAATSDHGNPIDPTGQAVTVLSAAPVLTSLSDSPDPIKGGNTLTITASGVSDPYNDTLQFYCSNSSTPNATNDVSCTAGNFADITYPYTTSCSFVTETDTTTHTIYCRTYDGTYYSQVKSTNYTTDSTPPATSVNNVAGDTAPTYYDTVNDAVTTIVVDGEANMSCRWGTSDSVYSGLSTGCTVSGTQATCISSPAQGTDSDYYVSCKDVLDNEQNTSQNLDITSLVVDWTAPSTTDNSVTSIQAPTYTVTIIENDNIYGAAAINTSYCTDNSTPYNCTPTLDIGDGNIVFTSRGVSVLKYYSIDPPGNVQSTVNKTININYLPNFTSAQDDAAVISGGATVTITTVASDPDPQVLSLFVCKTNSSTYNGCASTYCSTTAAADPACSFTSESDDAVHTWYAFIYDTLNESAPSTWTGSYTTVTVSPILVQLPLNGTYYNSTTVLANITLSSNANSAWFCLDNCSVNQTMQGSLTSWYYTIEGIGEGVHNVTFFANLSGNVTTSSSTITFAVDATPPGYQQYGNLPTLPTSEDNVTCYSRWLDNIWLAYAIVEENATGTFRNHTVSMSGTGSWGNYTLNASDTGVGVIQCRAYANDTTGNINSTLPWTFSVTRDTSPPTISNVTYTPTSVSDLDPGTAVTVTATVTDPAGLRNVLLQYKLGYATDWSSVPMTNISGDVFRANFTAFPAGNWVFRIRAEDNFSNVDESDANSINVVYDYTWVRTPADFGPLGGTVNSSVTLGILIINNTGDSSLSFDLSSTESAWVSYNITEPFDLAASDANDVQVNSTTPSTEGTYLLQITINATNDTASPDLLTTSATLVVSASGPNLYVTIDTYPSSATQGDTNITLSATVRNIGDQDATGVWFTWGLPSGWSTSSSLNKSVGFLGIGESAKDTLLADISSTAAVGYQTISLTAGSSENKTGSASKSVDVSALAGPGGGFGGGTNLARPKREKTEPSLTYKLSIEAPQLVEVVRGLTEDVPIKITNTGTGNLTQVYINASGFPAESNPRWFLRIEPDETKSAILRVSVPSTTAGGEYTQNILIEAKEGKKTTSFTLKVHEVSSKAAVEAIKKGADDIQAMKNAGFKTALIGDLIKKAQQAYDQGKYGEANDLYDRVHGRMATAFEVNDLIDKAKKRISESESQGKKVTAAKELLKMSETAFAQEDYVNAEKYAIDAIKAKMETLAIITGAVVRTPGEIVPPARTWTTVLKWLTTLVLGLFILFIAAGIGYIAVRPTLARGKISGLKKDQEATDELINKLDKTYYVSKDIGSKEYRTTRREYEAKNARLKQKIASLESKLKKDKKKKKEIAHES